MFNKRKRTAKAYFDEELINKLETFIDECHTRNINCPTIYKDKEYYKSLIEDVVEEIPKEYKRILFVIENTIDIEWRLTEYEDVNNEEYLHIAEKLPHYFAFIQAMLRYGYDEFIM